ncbi:MAG: hypothetical protein KJ709_02395 [Nanoarchaeota archaeon]|nr:hypothetical protein [Nanoarchaeota archaeon]
MRKITLLLALAFSLALVGCAQHGNDGSQWPDRPNNPDWQASGSMENLSGDKQVRLAEMQQGMMETCQGKAEGDTCTIETPRGAMEGTCGFHDAQLACTIERPR